LRIDVDFSLQRQVTFLNNVNFYQLFLLNSLRFIREINYILLIPLGGIRQMPRVLTLQIKDLEIPVILQVFSRDTLYGKNTVEKRSEEGKVYKHALLTMDGTHILPSGAVASGYVDPKGNFASQTLVVDSDGRALPVVRSIYKEPVKVSKTISIDEYYNYAVERTYILTSEEYGALDTLYQTCEKLLAQNKLYCFNYAYYDTTDPKTAIIIPKDEILFVAIAVFAIPIMLTLPEILYSDIEAEEEEELEEAIAFEVW
jgi:hypothetical protein